MARKKVLHVLGTLNPGGVEVWLMNLARNCAGANFVNDFCLLSSSNERGMYASEAEQLGCRIVMCPLQRNLLGFNSRLRKLIADGGYAAVHSHVHHFSGFVLRQAHLAGAKTRIAHSHNDLQNVHAKQSLKRRAYYLLCKLLLARHRTLGLACSDEAASSLFGAGWRLDPRNSVLPYGIDYKPFSANIDRKALRDEFGLDESHRVYGHVGRFHPQKNHRLMIELAREVWIREPNSRFVFVGDGPIQAEIRQYAEKLGVSGVIIFAGKRADIAAIMKSVFDVFLFPSLFEGLGIVLLEAQAAGLPCVLSDRIPEPAIVVEENCRVVPLDAPLQQWADQCMATQVVISQPEALERLENSVFALRKNIEFLGRAYNADCPSTTQ